jgi:hypothetical protein
MGKFDKENLVAEATEILEDEKDAYALVNEMISDKDKHGDIENLAKRFKSWHFLQLFRHHIENPLDNNLEKINDAYEYMFNELLKMINRTKEKQDMKEDDKILDGILKDIMADGKNNKGDINV